MCYREKGHVTKIMINPPKLNFLLQRRLTINRPCNQIHSRCTSAKNICSWNPSVWCLSSSSL